MGTVEIILCVEKVKQALSKNDAFGQCVLPSFILERNGFVFLSYYYDFFESLQIKIRIIYGLPTLSIHIL